MLEFIMEQNLLLYVLTAACVIGVASQLVLKQLYDRLIRDTKNTGEPEGKFQQQLRQRFQYCVHLNEKVGDVHALIRKSIMEYRFWGMNLHQWKRFGAGCLAVSLLCALGGTMALLQSGGSLVAGNTYFWMGALALALMAGVYGITEPGYRQESLEVRLADYLLNSGAARDLREDAGEDEFEEEYENTAPIVSVADGRKSRRKARSEVAASSESKAAKEKRELKENLARVKASMKETAAEREKERGADLLRQMDPGEQERILREVLKEFLS